MRLMRLTDRWRMARPNLDFADIATARAVDELLDVLDVNGPAVS